MGAVLAIVLIAAAVLMVVLRLHHATMYDRWKDRRRVPTSQRMAQRRQFRGFEGDLLAQRDGPEPDRGATGT